MSWKKALIVPTVIRLARRAGKDTGTRWDDYWAGVRRTGAQGDVLWDSSSPREALLYREHLGQHSDRSLPIVDVGCGNGRYTRSLADMFPHALGVDLSPHAVRRAVEESRAVDNVAFRPLDLTAPGAGRELVAEMGESNVFVRGVFHVLDPSARVAMADNLRDLVGARGTLLLAETAYPSGVLGYLEHLGGTAKRLPPPLERAISTGLPRPARFDDAALAGCFPPSRWRILTSGPTVIDAVPMRTPDQPEAVPGFLAVLQSRAPTHSPAADVQTSGTPD